jgi:hypothetical protein
VGLVAVSSAAWLSMRPTALVWAVEALRSNQEDLEADEAFSFFVVRLEASLCPYFIGFQLALLPLGKVLFRKVPSFFV